MFSTAMLKYKVSTLSVIRHLMWQQLELASKLECDLQDTAVCGGKWLVGFNAWKTRLVSFDQSNGAIDEKMNGSALEKKSSFKMLGLVSLVNLIGTLTLSLLLKLPPRKLMPWFVLSSFFLCCSKFVSCICISKNLPYNYP